MMQSDTHTLPIIPEPVKDASSVLSNPVFRALWLATLASNIGSTMQDVGAAWLMTELAPKAFMVSLIQTSGTLPIFLFSLIAGALADIISRRTMLFVTQAWMALLALVFAWMTYNHLMQPWTLLALNFGLAVGTAFNIPPWQSVTSDIVERGELKQAIVMQSAGSNIARSVGPALGGLVVAAWGSAAVFALNAISYIGVLLVLVVWRPKKSKSKLPAERFFTAIRTAVAYARHSNELQNILVRTVLFIFGAIAAMSLLPLLVKERLHEGPKVLGLLYGLNGAGAVGMAVWLKKRAMKPDDELTFGTIAYGTAITILAWTRDFIPYSIAMLLAGAGWLMANSTLNTATQLSSPTWVKARAVSIQQLVFYGSIAIGSMWWGFASMRVGTHNAMSFAAIFLFVGLIAAKVTKVSHAFEVKVDESVFLAEPEVDHDHPIPLEHGPVMVTTEYVIDDSRHNQFEEDMQQIRMMRLRTGAMRWEIFCDASNHRRYVEIFFSDTWADHLRLHERTTRADRDLQERVYSYHVLPDPPKTTHYIYDTAKNFKDSKDARAQES
jgi:MFS family permease